MTKEANDLIQELEQNNALPTNGVELPTQGKFYYEDVLVEGAQPNYIHVRGLTIEAELAFKDPFLLASGKAIPKIIRAVAPEIAQPEELATVDIDAILLACRLTSYGPDLKFKHTCANPEAKEDGTPKCREENDVLVNLHEHLTRYAPMTNFADYELDIEIPKYDENGTQVGVVKQKAILRPMPYRAEFTSLKNSFRSERLFEQIKDVSIDDFIIDSTQVDTYAKIVDNNTEAGITMIVESIFYAQTQSGKKINDPDQLREWVRILPSSVLDKISARINELAKINADRSHVVYKCASCGFDNTAQIQMDPNKLFFSEPPGLPPPMKSSPSFEKKPKRTKPHSRTLSR